MGKIKLNLVSGAVVEKPLINAFKANNNSYIVLDNEMNGSMGLPIILVCKYENDKLTKILDQNEWGIVKEYLKNIIAGNQIEFIKINEELVADDIYYTQLTLPVPSFDALKNAYKVEESGNVEVSVEENVSNMALETPVVDMPNADVVTPDIEVTPAVEEPVIPVVEPVQEEVATPVIDIPVAPQVENTFVAPVMPEVTVEPVISPVVEPTMPSDIVPPVVEPEITPTPVIEPVMPEKEEVVDEGSIFREQKEAFMQACENMFDALVQKFERELENRK